MFGDYVVVWGGHKLYFLDPRPSDYEPVRVANALANEARFAGNYGPGYSVCQHSVLVSMCVEVLGGNNRQQLAGLVHDAFEIVTGDVPSPLKRHFNGFKKLEAINNAAIEARYNVYLDDPIVHEADKLVLAAEVRMLVPEGEQHLFAVDPKYRVKDHPGWLNVLPWSRQEAVANFLDKHDYLQAELADERPGEN